MRGRRVPSRAWTFVWLFLPAVRSRQRPMTYDDLPIIRIKPTPTDDELERERDAKHRRELREWDDDDEWPVGEVIG